jgi:hypothetical protein
MNILEFAVLIWLGSLAAGFFGIVNRLAERGGNRTTPGLTTSYLNKESPIVPFAVKR